MERIADGRDHDAQRPYRERREIDVAPIQMMRAIEEVEFVAEVAVAAIGCEVDEKNRGRECEDDAPAALSFGLDGQGAIFNAPALSLQRRRFNAPSLMRLAEGRAVDRGS